MWILPRAEGKYGRVRAGINEVGSGARRPVWATRKRPGVGRDAKAASKEGRALPAARPRYTIGGGGTCAGKKGQALAAAAGMHLESRLFASAKAGRGGGPGPGQLWRDARGLSLTLAPSPPPEAGGLLWAGARDRSRDGYTYGAKRQCTYAVGMDASI
jgi:hypothetical protein